jgi:hypothetical protein
VRSPRQNALTKSKIVKPHVSLVMQNTSCKMPLLIFSFGMPFKIVFNTTPIKYEIKPSQRNEAFFKRRRIFLKILKICQMYSS